MLEMLMQWYRRRFSDPEAIALLVILVAGFGILFFFSGLLAPLLVAIVLAYLLEWPTARLEHIGCSLCGDAGGLAAGDLPYSRHARHAEQAF